MTAPLTVNRDRRKLLDSVRRGRVFVANGKTFCAHGNIKHRCDNKVRQLEDAGWVVLGASDIYELTGEGAAVLAGGAP